MRDAKNSAALPQGRAKAEAVRVMFDTIAPRYEMVNRLISFGLDRKWRRQTLKSMTLPANSLVLDLATGTGDFCRLLEASGHRPVGADLSLGMLEHAKTSTPLIQADALCLPLSSASVDAVTCGFALRNFVHLPSFFDELARVVKPGGCIGLLDAAAPKSRLVRFGHGIWFGKVVPKIGALLSDRSAYSYLPKSLAYLPERQELLEWIERAGFEEVRHRSLTFGAAQLITARRPVSESG